jgi:protein-tyrosine-phosphatase
MAEAIARRQAADVLEPSSAGLSPLGCIAELTQETLIRNGYQVEGLASKPIRREAWRNADLVVNLSGESLEAEFDEPQRVEDWDIADPYGTDPGFYQRILEELEEGVQKLAERLREARRNSRSN